MANADLCVYFPGVAAYEWGKLGSTSAAGRFAAATPRDDLQVQDDKPYAEVDTLHAWQETSKQGC
jgi:hypothetical protein